MSSTNPHRPGDTSKSINDFKNDDEGRVRVPLTVLSIIWGNDQRYWKKIDNPESPDAVAELIQVCWLEVTGSIDLGPDKIQKKFEVGFRVSLTPDAFGWNNSPVYIMGKTGKNATWRKLNLINDSGEEFDIPDKPLIVNPPKEASGDTKLYFGLYEVWSGRWKGGLKIHYAFVREVSDSKQKKEASSSESSK